ncbi:receptor-like protein 7 [Quercus suber]|uniref:Receptor-like protein 7 n=1 Tax=Quercus suber TaxID=58331 RepID=A0AAW0LJW0_QUESU
MEFTDVKELLSWLFVEDKSVELFAFTAWMVWNQRNKIRASQNAVPLHLLCYDLQRDGRGYEDAWRGHTKQALLKRKVTADPICERCRSAVEESVHAVWSCSELGEVWDVGDEWCFRSEMEFTDVKELLSWLFVEDKSVELFAFTAWMVWNQRNKIRASQNAVPLHLVAEQAKQKLNQFKADWRNPRVRALEVLDVSNNQLIGQIPQCLLNSSNSLVLSMRNNHFQGNLPEPFINGCSLRTLDLNHNQIEGKIP